MKKVFTYLLLVVLFTGLNSCTKEWLELEPQGVFLEENFYQNDEQAFQGLAAAYSFLRVKLMNNPAQEYCSQNFLCTWPSDNSSVGGSGLGDRMQLQVIGTYQWTAESLPVFFIWQKCYYGINRCNLVIHNPDFESDVLPEFQAEAKFLRAYYYFELLRFFGDVVLYTTNLVPADYNQTRAPKEEVFTVIVQDLQDAIAVLPEKSQRAPIDYVRATKGAAEALLGKVYLFMASPYYNMGDEYYQKAADMFNSVITKGEYGLESNYDNIWNWNSEHGVESIFEIQFSERSSLEGWWNGRQASGNIDVQLSGPRLDAASDTLSGGWGFDLPTQSLIDAYNAQGDDVRHDATCLTESFIQSTGGTLNTTQIPPTFAGSYSKKRTTWSYLLFSPSPRWQWPTNERIIRYADVLLMAAEANNRKPSPDDGKAAEYVNMVRARAELDPISGGGDDLYARIKLERRLELAMEGHRYHDLIRWGDAGTVLADRGFKAGVHEVYPIPYSEILVSNGSLTQNPGY